MFAYRPAWLVFVLVVVAWCAGAQPASAQLGSLISPGPLAKPHASLEGVANCAKCHEQGRRVTAQKCLACHAPVAQRIARKRGVHKDVTGDCEVCHAEHAGLDGELRPFDTASFDHASTGFPLVGKHALGARKCAACHTGRSFLEAGSACASCHADVHKGTLGQDCASCHPVTGTFKGSATGFDHARTAFPLAGAHRTVACASCHPGGTFKGVTFETCASCHKDPHRPAQGGACASCHTVETWRTKTVNHDRTDFRLGGLHARVACVACHRQPPMKAPVRSDTCAACHADPHRGAFQQDCGSCHTVAGWTQAAFDHARTRFPLTGRHEIECVKCHRPTTQGGVTAVVDFRGLETACASCHTDVHQGELGAACDTCHSSTTFAVRQYTHTKADGFFAGQHAPLTCAQCHVAPPPTRPVRTGGALPAVRFASVSRTCTTCHADVHLGQLAGACETCHSVEAPKFAATVDHARTKFPLKGRHASVECRGCHASETAAFPAGRGTAIRLSGLSTECRACHADVHLGQLGAACETCHAEETFHIPAYTHRTRAVAGLMTGAHARAACADCHKPAAGRFPGGTGTATRYLTGTTCVSCHADVHRGALGPNCGTCHRP